jgi:uncharacterized repeat protein (TIGR01451 family)
MDRIKRLLGAMRTAPRTQYPRPPILLIISVMLGFSFLISHMVPESIVDRTTASATSPAQDMTFDPPTPSMSTLWFLKDVTDENGGNLEPGDTLLYTITIQNRSNNHKFEDLEFTDDIPADTSYKAESVTAPSGSKVESETPTLYITGINVEPKEQVILTFRVQVNAGATEISNQAKLEDPDGDTLLSDGDKPKQPTTITVTAGPNFDQTTKAVELQTDANGDGAVGPGDTLRYTVKLYNTGDIDSGSSTAFEDPIPFNTSYVTGSVSATDGTVNYNAGSNRIDWAGDVSAGETVTIVFDVTVDSGIVTGTTLSNQGTVYYASDGGGTNDSSELTDANLTEPGRQPTQVIVGGSPEGVAIKSVTDENGGNLEPGDSLLYTIVFRNQSGFDVNDLEFIEEIPADTTYIPSSVTIPSGSTVVSETPVLRITGIDVPAHGQVEVTFRVEVFDSVPAGVTQIINQGTVFYDSDGDGTNDTLQQTDGDTAQSGNQPTTIAITAGPNFDQTTKAVALQTDANGDGAVGPGDTLRYTVKLYNTGDIDSGSSTAFEDPIPFNTSYVTGSVSATDGTVNYNAGSNRIDWAGDVSAGETVTIVFDVTVDSGIVTGTTLSNQGTVYYASDGGGTNDSSELTDANLTEPGRQPTQVIVGGSPEGVAIKSVTDENGGNLEPGDSLLYTIVFRNQSGFDVNDLEFIEEIPADTTYIPSSVTIPSGSTVVSETPVLRITGIDVPAHGQVEVTFRVEVFDPVPAGVTQIINQGTVFYDSDGDGTNDATQQTDGDTTQPGEQPTVIPVTAGSNFGETTKAAALQIDADGNGVITPGDTLRYTVVIKNTGDQDATGVTFTDPIPADTTYVTGSVTATSGSADNVAGSIEWTGDVAVGSRVTITFEVTVNSGIMTGAVISNQGTVAYDDSTVLTDGNPSEPGAQPTDVTVGGMPEGVAIKNVTDENGGNVEPGDSLLYSIVLRNESGFDVVGMEFTDAIPADTTYIATSATAPAGSTVASETPLLRITGINVPAHSQALITFRVSAINPLPAGVSEIVNQGTVFYDSDGDGTNDATQQTDGDTTQPGEQPTVIPVTAGSNFGETTKAAALQIDADGNGVITPGDTLRYTVVIKNTGDQDATGVTFTDPIPADTTYVTGSVTATSGSADNVAGSIEWTGDVAVGSRVTITFEVTVNSGIMTGAVISNQGTVAYDDSTVLTDGNPSEPGAQPTDVTVGGMPEGVAIKSVTDENGGNVEPGDSLLYTIVFRNQSGFDVNDLEFIEEIPADTTYIAASVTVPSGSQVESEKPVLRVTGIDVPARGQVEVTFRVQVVDPVPAGVTQIINQGTVFYDSDGDGTNDATQQTDGDTAQPGNQPTTIAVTAGPNFDQTTKAAKLQTDANGDGAVGPGDTLRYTVKVYNTGNMHSGSSTAFEDPIPFNTTYVTGSVSATDGTVNYNAGSNRIDWTGEVSAGGTVTLVFDVTVDSGIATGTTLSNQGTVYYASDGGGTNDSSELTDANLTEPGRQPTQVTVGGSPEGVAIKSVTDENGGNVEPRDSLLYTIVFRNQSGFDVNDLEFIEEIPADTTYIPSSVTIPSGSTVVSETPVLRITGIDVPARGQVEVTFRVQVINPVPAGVTQIINQGTVFYDSDGNGTNDTLQQTDGDTAQPGNQPTTIAVTPKPPPIPTLSEWGMILLGILLTGIAVRINRTILCKSGTLERK